MKLQTRKIEILAFSAMIFFINSTIHAKSIYPAEVVGRDLNYLGLGWMGHVGVTMAATIDDVAPWVVEVLNDPNRVVQVNYISNFKRQSPYWGSRYGIANNRVRTLMVLREANAQRCLRSNYTLTSIFWPAKGNMDGYSTDTCKTEIMGQFRCDTFMVYTFSVGGYTVLRGGSLLPKNVFASFPYGNGDGPYAVSHQNESNKEKFNNNYNLDDISPTDLNRLNQEDFISVIDRPENAKNADIDDKIWNLYKNNKIEDFDKKYFLLDYLGGVAGPNLLPEIIDEYSRTSNPDLKHMLLRSTQSIYTREFRLKNDLSKREVLINFYLDLLNQDSSSKKLPLIDAQIISTGLIDIASTEIVLGNIKKINSIFERAQPYEQIGFKCNLMLDIKLLENTYIPEIIELLTKENNRQLDERFFSYIKDALSKDINNFSLEIKSMIGNYLNLVDYKYENMHYPFIKSDKPSSLFVFGSWLESLALINSNSFDEAGYFIAEFLKTKSIVEQANFIVGFSHSAYLKKAFKTEPVFLKFVEKNKNIKLVPFAKDPKQEMINTGIQYAVSVIEGKV